MPASYVRYNMPFMDGVANKSPRSVYASKLGEFPTLVLVDAAGFQHRGQWRKLFRQRIGPSFDDRVVVEVGCFDAEYLCKIAAKFPTTGFIGIDWKCRPLYDGARRAFANSISNIILIRGRGQNVPNMFSPAEIDQIWVFHPDPFDRPVEMVNRLVGESFLTAVHKLLRDNTSTLCLKTDHPGYYKHVLDFVNAPTGSSPLGSVYDCFEVTVNSLDYWHDPKAIAATADRHFAGEITHFEDRFIRRRQPIFYLELQKRS